MKFGVKESTSSTPNFIPVGASCRPVGAKDLTIALEYKSKYWRMLREHPIGNYICNYNDRNLYQSLERRTPHEQTIRSTFRSGIVTIANDLNIAWFA